MQVFENGYNRLRENSNVIGYQYTPVKILNVPEQTTSAEATQIETIPCINLEHKEDKSSTTSKATTDSYDYSATQTPKSITNVFDSKNQLTSLIKNAQQNEDSLKERNKRVSQAKQQSKRQYGW